MSRLNKGFGKDQTNEEPTLEEQSAAKATITKKIGIKSSSIKELDHTFYRYLVSKVLLKPNEPAVDSEIPDNRILLDVELGPALKRQAERQASLDLFRTLEAQLFKTVEDTAQAQLTNLDAESLRRFAISENLMSAMNVLNARAASISRLKPLVVKDRGLMQNMVTLLNRFSIGQKSSGKSLELKDAELSLSFLGVDHLRLLMPFLVMHEALKDSGRKFNQTSRKLWMHIQITAEAARQLSITKEIGNPNEVYMQAIFHEIGAIYILHVIDECFSVQLKNLNKLAKEGESSEVSDRISEIKSAAPVLDKILPLRGAEISFRLAQAFKLSHLPLRNTLEQLSNAMTMDELSPTARLIAQGRAYAVFKQMFKAELMNKAQASAYLKYYQLNADSIRMLNKVKFLKVPAIEV